MVQVFLHLGLIVLELHSARIDVLLVLAQKLVQLVLLLLLLLFRLGSKF